jgi:hypothetical protein
MLAKRAEVAELAERHLPLIWSCNPKSFQMFPMLMPSVTVFAPSTGDASTVWEYS